MSCRIIPPFPFHHSQHTPVCPAFKQALVLSEVFILSPSPMKQKLGYWLGKHRKDTALGQMDLWEGMEKTSYVTCPTLASTAGAFCSARFLSLQGICAASTGWKLVASFLTEWILLGKCWLTQNTALYSVCQIQWSSDWESVFCPRMKFLLLTTDWGPPPSSQKSSSQSCLLKCGRSGAKTLQPRFYSPSMKICRSKSQKIIWCLKFKHLLFYSLSS